MAPVSFSHTLLQKGLKCQIIGDLHVFLYLLGESGVFLFLKTSWISVMLGYHSDMSGMSGYNGRTSFLGPKPPTT